MMDMKSMLYLFVSLIIDLCHKIMTTIPFSTIGYWSYKVDCIPVNRSPSGMAVVLSPAGRHPSSFAVAPLLNKKIL